MAARVDIDYNYAAITALQTRVSFMVAKKGADSAQARAQRYAPKMTGALAASIQVSIVGTSGLVTTFRIYSPLDYAAYQEFGTGPITPKSAKVLVFKVGGQKVFAMRTSGVPATHFMRRAGLAMTQNDFV